MDTATTLKTRSVRGLKLAHVMQPAGNPLRQRHGYNLTPITSHNARMIKRSILRALLDHETIAVGQIMNATHAPLERVEGFIAELRARGFKINETRPKNHKRDRTDPAYRRAIVLDLDAHSVSDAQAYCAGVDF